MTDEPIAFVLAPIDQGTRNVGGRPGAAGAPSAIVEGLRDAGLFPKGARVIEPPLGNTAESLEEDLTWLADTVEVLVEQGQFPVVLGGDHGTTYATVRGLAAASATPPGVAYLDVHFDLRDFHPAHTSGSSFRRLVEEGIVPPDRVHPLGILRPTDPAALERSRFDELAAWADERGISWASLEALRKKGTADAVRARLAGVGPWHLSFDVDCLDEEHAPGVSAPGAGRLGLDEAIEGVRAGAPLCDVFDVVEFAPRLDDEEGTTLESVVAVIEAFLDARGAR